MAGSKSNCNFEARKTRKRPKKLQIDLITIGGV